MTVEPAKVGRTPSHLPDQRQQPAPSSPHQGICRQGAAAAKGIGPLRCRPPRRTGHYILSSAVLSRVVPGTSSSPTGSLNSNPSPAPSRSQFDEQKDGKHDSKKGHAHAGRASTARACQRAGPHKPAPQHDPRRSFRNARRTSAGEQEGAHVTKVDTLFRRDSRAWTMKTWPAGRRG